MKVRRKSRDRQSGYVLITLMLFVALLAIAALGVATKADFQSKRDREEELVHRGVQYARAVRLFFKKTGRYPTRIEELENTNNRRFLRKRYKDPITGEDFKLLRIGDVKLTFGPGITGAVSPAAMPGGQAMNASQAGQAMAAAAASMGQSSIPGAAPLNQQNAGDPEKGESTGSSTKSEQPSTGGFSGPTLGGGPILGVASKSKKESIREFNKKNHYDQWQFIYDPSSDRGGLLNTPAQPPLQGTAVTPTGTPQPGARAGTNPVTSPAPAAPTGQTPSANEPPN
jgi:type II secretory pathway pseudopilin PulG